MSLAFLNNGVDFAELAEDLGEFCEGDLIGAIGKGFGWIRVSLDEDTIAASSNSSAGKNGGKFAIAPRSSTESARTLHRVGGVKDGAIAELAHPVERAHVGDEILIAKSSAALGEHEVFTADGLELVGDVFDIPGGHELAFFDIHGATRLTGGEDEIGLTGQEGGYLEEVDVLSGDFCLLRRMDVGSDRNAELFTDALEELAAGFDTDSSVGAAGTAVGFVVGGFEDPLQAQAVGEGTEALGHVPDEIFALNHTGAEDEKGFAAIDEDGADFDHRERKHARENGGTAAHFMRTGSRC